MRTSALLTLFVLLSATVALPQETPNLVPDAGFEGPLADWQHWPSDSPGTFARDTTVRRSGEASLRITIPTWRSCLYVLRACPGARPGTAYRLTFCYRLAPGTPASAVAMRLNYSARQADGTVAMTGSGPKYVAREQADNGWIIRQVDLRTPANLARADIIVGLSGWPGTVWFDDLEMRPLGKTLGAPVGLLEYYPEAVEQLVGPQSRMNALRKAQAPIYVAGMAYNNALMALAALRMDAARLRREAGYTAGGLGLPGVAGAQDATQRAHEALDHAYQAYGEAFTSPQDAARLQSFEATLQAASAARAAAEKQIAAARRQLAAAGLRRFECPELAPLPTPAPPWFSADGRADRVIYGGAGANTERCPWFGFQFTLSWGGYPMAWHGETPDFSGFDIAMQVVKREGYDTAHASVPLVEWSDAMAPDWILEAAKTDTDVIVHDAEGKAAALTPKSPVQPLNIFHPRVRAMAQNAARELARYITGKYTRAQVMGYLYATENYNFFAVGGQFREIGYGAAATAAFHEYLRRKFGTIEQLNRAWGSTYGSFADIQQPPDRNLVERRSSSPLIYEFESFTDDAYLEYLKGIYQAFKEVDPARPVMIDETDALRNINGARLFECCDLFSVHTTAPEYAVESAYLATLARYSGKGSFYLEDQWGRGEEMNQISDELAQFAALRKTAYRNTVQGKNPQVYWYEYTNADYLTVYNGNWYDPRYDLTTLRYCAGGLATSLTQCRRLERVFTQTTVTPARLMIMHPETSFRVAFPYRAVFDETIAAHCLLFPRNFTYELVPESYVRDGRCKLNDFTAVVLPYAPYFPPGLAAQLRSWVERGGTLVCLGPAGVRTPYGRPDGALLREFGDVRELPEPAFPWQWAVTPATGTTKLAEGVYTRPMGRGRVVVTDRPLTAVGAVPQAPAALTALLAQQPVRRAWCRSDKFELVMRQDRAGGRYLFALNPDAHDAAEDTVVIAGPVREAVDLDAGGAVVPVTRRGNNTELKLWLGATDFTCLRLR